MRRADDLAALAGEPVLSTGGVVVLVGPQLRFVLAGPEMRISLMLAVPSAPAASQWYQRAVDAAELWSLGSVIGLQIQGAPFFLHEPTDTFVRPAVAGATTVRVEVFCDDPDAFVARAVAAGAEGSAVAVTDHQAPWGIHRQGGFTDPFGHRWLVGDRSPLQYRQP